MCIRDSCVSAEADVPPGREAGAADGVCAHADVLGRRPSVTTAPTWHHPREHAVVTLARNVSTRYVLIIVNVLIGLVMLRYNVRHLGQDTYGLLILANSVTAYFTVFDFGYGSA